MLLASLDSASCAHADTGVSDVMSSKLRTRENKRRENGSAAPVLGARNCPTMRNHLLPGLSCDGQVFRLRLNWERPACNCRLSCAFACFRFSPLDGEARTSGARSGETQGGVGVPSAFTVPGRARGFHPHSPQPSGPMPPDRRGAPRNPSMPMGSFDHLDRIRRGRDMRTIFSAEETAGERGLPSAIQAGQDFSEALLPMTRQR